jgi:hypothetical protein
MRGFGEKTAGISRNQGPLDEARLADESAENRLGFLLAGKHVETGKRDRGTDVARETTALLGLLSQIGGRHHEITYATRRDSWQTQWPALEANAGHDAIAVMSDIRRNS